MLRASILAALTALFSLTASAFAESPPNPMCECTEDETCWESAQQCVANEEVCADSSTCEPGMVCDVRGGDASVPGRCVAPTLPCDADAACSIDQLCSGTGLLNPGCADGDDACAATQVPVCGYPTVCGIEGAPEGCPGTLVCAQSRCTAPEYVDAIEAIEADIDHVFAYRDLQNQGFGDDDESTCAAVPGGPGGSGLAILGLLTLVGLRRRRSIAVS